MKEKNHQRRNSSWKQLIDTLALNPFNPVPTVYNAISTITK
jgi:hypothetical protein